MRLPTTDGIEQRDGLEARKGRGSVGSRAEEDVALVPTGIDRREHDELVGREAGAELGVRRADRRNEDRRAERRVEVARSADVSAGVGRSRIERDRRVACAVERTAGLCARLYEIGIATRACEHRGEGADG